MVERVAAIRELDELLVVAAFGVGDAMEGIGIAACTVNTDFQIAAGVVWLAFWGDVIGLLQEVVVRPADGAIRRSEDCGLVEAISGNGQVFVDIGDMATISAEPSPLMSAMMGYSVPVPAAILRVKRLLGVVLLPLMIRKFSLSR